jgi:hypothetical protein
MPGYGGPIPGRSIAGTIPRVSLGDEFELATATDGALAGAWEDQALTGIPNGSFSLNAVADPVDVGRTAHVPYWTLARVSGVPVFEALAGRLYVDYPASGDTGGLTSDPIRVRQGGRYRVRLVEEHDSLSGTLPRTARLHEYDVAGVFLRTTIISSESLPASSGSGPSINTTRGLQTLYSIVGGLTHAVTVEVQAGPYGGGDPATYRLYEVQLIEDTTAELVTLTYVHDATVGTATTSMFLSDVSLAAGGGFMAMPWDGRVVGISIRSTADRTAGSATAQANLNGVTQTGLQAVLDATAVRNATVAGVGVAFVAGDRIGADVVTAAWTPTTADFIVTLWLEVFRD